MGIPALKVVLNKNALRSQPRGKTPSTLVLTRDQSASADLEIDGRGVITQNRRILCGEESYTFVAPLKWSPVLRLQILQLLTVLSAHFEHITYAPDAEFDADLAALLSRRAPGLASQLGLYL